MAWHYVCLGAIGLQVIINPALTPAGSVTQKGLGLELGKPMVLHLHVLRASVLPLQAAVCLDLENAAIFVIC